MKMKIELIAVSFLLLTAFAWAGKWTIDSFDPSTDPGEPDNYIAEEFSGGLKVVKPEQVTKQGDRFYVRQKFEDPFGDDEASYQIFQGRQTSDTKSLGRISTEGMPYTTLLKMKLFYSKTATGDDDLETVYYDGKDVFVEGEDPVYINLNGRMEELKPMVSREYKISLTSDPSGATVTIGSSEKGTTPVTFTVPSSKTVAVVVNKEGYYPVIKPITPNEKQTVQEGVLLTKKIPLVNPATTFRSQLEAANAKKDAKAVQSIKANIQQTLNNYNAATKKMADEALAKFPPNPPKLSNEGANEYSARQSLWTNTQAKERDALNKDAQLFFNDLKDLLAEADASSSDMDFVLKYEYIPSSAITFNNMGIRDFSINASVNNSRVKFKYDNAKLAYGSTSRDEISDEEERVHGVLKIWDVPNESGKYASIYDIAFFFDDTPLKIISKGNFTMSEANGSSRKTESDLNSRIAKYPGKTAWIKKDEAATLDVLRTGERQSTSVAKSKPAPVEDDDDDDEAYYDEDEDEDEIEESVSKQERQDYSRYNATSASDIFGNTDEYLFWSGMVFAAAAIGLGVKGFLENKNYLDANDALQKTNNEINTTKDQIARECRNAPDGDFNKCVSFFERESSQQPPDGIEIGGPDDIYALYRLNNIKSVNEDAKKTYNMNRIIWFSGAGLAAAISITLFAW